MKKEVIAHKDPKSPISEIFRTLRTNIQFMSTNKKMKTILVTSTFQGEGKSWATANLAVTFAQTGKNVLLIDADMRRGRQYTLFEASPKPGLSNYLSQVEYDEEGNGSEDLNEYIQETEMENLYIITAGNIPPNPSELLVSNQMANLLEQLKELFDIIIIDGTPCELVTDSVILSRIVDSTIIVTAHNMTKKDALQRAVRNIQNVGGTIAGVVLNKVPITAKRYEESYYYGSTEVKNKKSQVKRNNNISRNNKNSRIPNNNVKHAQNNINHDSNNNIKKELNNNSKVNNNSDLNIDTAKNANTNKDEENNVNFLDKTNEILKQINDYLDNEKKKIK